MIARIFIQNFALIDKLDINLNNGLQVITGETGAGKSIILGALRLVMGERADLKAMSNQSLKSIVEVEIVLEDNQHQAFFEENDLDYDQHCIIRREISPQGKSRAFINDVPVSIGLLQSFSQGLLDVHSQFQTAKLFTNTYQFKIIDALSQNQQLLPEYQQNYNQYLLLKQRIKNLQENQAQNIKNQDYNSYLCNELVEAQLEGIDFEQMQQQWKNLEFSGQITELLSQSMQLFNHDLGLANQCLELRNKLSKVADLSTDFQQIFERSESLYYELNDLQMELEHKAEHVELNPEDLMHLTQKINLIQGLFVKHQVNNVPDLLQIQEELTLSLSSAENLDQEIEKLNKEAQKIHQSLVKSAKIISKNRHDSSAIFSQKAEEILKRLGLEKAKIAVQLEPLAEPNIYGMEQIAFLFQANSGYELKPIQDAISGGERSRLMLAIKKIMAENTSLPTLILDEIDTGVSGKVAEEMALLMQEMADNMQLIVITHLAQVAAKGSHHYKVMKSEKEGKTQSTIVPLSQDERLKEIAQLLSGAEITDAAYQQAQLLMNK
jgi:DNA repair protein RecN (Recombination protein N)